MRLIDADAFKEMVGTDTKIRKMFCDVIDTQPTAYDVEKVVEQINGIEVVLPIDYISADNIEFTNKILRLVKDGTINIVRKGGA